MIFLILIVGASDVWEDIQSFDIEVDGEVKRVRLANLIATKDDDDSDEVDVKDAFLEAVNDALGD